MSSSGCSGRRAEQLSDNSSRPLDSSHEDIDREARPPPEPLPHSSLAVLSTYSTASIGGSVASTVSLPTVSLACIQAACPSVTSVALQSSPGDRTRTQNDDAEAVGQDVVSLRNTVLQQAARIHELPVALNAATTTYRHEDEMHELNEALDVTSLICSHEEEIPDKSNSESPRFSTADWRTSAHFNQREQLSARMLVFKDAESSFSKSFHSSTSFSSKNPDTSRIGRLERSAQTLESDSTCALRLHLAIAVSRQGNLWNRLENTKHLLTDSTKQVADLQESLTEKSLELQHLQEKTEPVMHQLSAAFMALRDLSRLQHQERVSAREEIAALKQELKKAQEQSAFTPVDASRLDDHQMPKELPVQLHLETEKKLKETRAKLEDLESRHSLLVSTLARVTNFLRSPGDPCDGHL